MGNHSNRSRKRRDGLAAQLETADVVAIFECGGTTKTATITIEAAPMGAQIIIVGLTHEPVPFVPLDITRRGLSILTSMIYDHPVDFSRVIELIAKGVIQAISRRYSFNQLPPALAQAATWAKTKVVLVLN